jgi:hypothetical protein
MKLPRWPFRLYEKLMAPGRARRSLRQILHHGQGHARSVRAGEPVDRAGNPIPWFTYPAIAYLEQLDFSDKHVFEFGAGNSTRFWCARAARVVSVEHDPAWHRRVASHLPANGELVLREARADYASALGQRVGRFDVIVIDGVERRACCEVAIGKLQPGGLIILDNADWHHRCAEYLRAQGLIEVDMTGFGPINGYTWTTSFFLHREFAFQPRQTRQPWHGIGSLPHVEEEG